MNITRKITLKFSRPEIIEALKGYYKHILEIQAIPEARVSTVNIDASGTGPVVLWWNSDQGDRT